MRGRRHRRDLPQRQGRRRRARHFWHDEYLLNAYIGRYPKPYVALMDGITMGGGVGISAHGSVRVVTETTKMAMPEVGIGFVPDVGGTRILAHAPGNLGVHAALTGALFRGADAIAMGFADHYVPHADLAQFVTAIETDGVDHAVSAYAQEPPPSELMAHREWIDRCYAGETVAEIIDALGSETTPAAAEAAELISPAPSRCRSRWRPCAVPAHCRLWKMFCARSSGPRARRCGQRIWWRASGRRSSTRTATPVVAGDAGSGHRRRRGGLLRPADPDLTFQTV